MRCPTDEDKASLGAPSRDCRVAPAEPGRFGMFDRKHDQRNVEQAAAGKGIPDVHGAFDGLLCLPHQRRRRLGCLGAQGRPHHWRLVNELSQKFVRKRVEQDQPRHFGRLRHAKSWTRNAAKEKPTRITGLLMAKLFSTAVSSSAMS